MANNKPRKKDSARLVWDTKPRRAPNPKDIEFQTAEVVIPNPKTARELPLSFRDGVLSETYQSQYFCAVFSCLVGTTVVQYN